MRARLSGFLEALPITIDTAIAERAWTATAPLVERYRLTAYDAAYLEVALRLALPLATTDAALVAAARQAGVGRVLAG